MSAVTIEPEVLEDLERAATELQSTVEAVLSEAVQRYLWDLRRHAVSRESQAYRRQHTQLRQQYDGLYIAMRDGQVVDSGPHFEELRERVRRKWGDTAVMITRVTEEPEITITRRGFTELADEP
jgi:hypothetical protein